MRLGPLHHLRSFLLLLAPVVGAAQPAWRVDRTPVVTVNASAPNGDVQFQIVSWATRLANGEIAIADGADGAIRIADPKGVVTRTLGRKGSGPGEFSLLTWVGRCGADSLYAWDARSARVSVFDAKGAYTRQFAVVPASTSFTVACSANGALAFFTSLQPRRDASPPTMRQTEDGRQYQVGTLRANVLVVNAAGATTREIMDVTFGEMLMGQLTPGGGRGGMPRPLGHLSGFAFVGDDLAVGTTDSAAIAIYGAAGDPKLRFTVPPVSGVPTMAQYERAIVPAIAIAPPQMHAQLTDFAKLVTRPERFPAFSRVLGSSDGLVWLVVSPDGEPVTKLRAHRITGEVVATLEIPAAVAVFEIGSDYVLGRIENADGEQGVVVYRYARR